MDDSSHASGPCSARVGAHRAGDPGGPFRHGLGHSRQPSRVPAALGRAGRPRLLAHAFVHLASGQAVRRPLPVPDLDLDELPGRDARVQGHERRAAGRDRSAPAPVDDRPAVRALDAGALDLLERPVGDSVEQAVRLQHPMGRKRGSEAASGARRAGPLGPDRRCATAYEVLYPDLVPAVSFQTTTNVADERELFTFHSALGYTTIHWRVRAIRDIGQFQSSTNGLPAVSYGPWSPTFTTTNAPQTNGTLTPTDAVSDTWDKSGKAGSAHQLTPGFAWTPSAPVISEAIDPGSSLYRVYIFSDKNCVNRVFTGSIVGSPAWAPRTIGGPMPLPGDTDTLGTDADLAALPHRAPAPKVRPSTPPVQPWSRTRRPGHRLARSAASDRRPSASAAGAAAIGEASTSGTPAGRVGASTGPSYPSRSSSRRSPR